ncbi:MAG: LPS assembly protein LptD, partial [Planctomycetota bacterium]
MSARSNAGAGRKGSDRCDADGTRVRPRPYVIRFTLLVVGFGLAGSNAWGQSPSRASPSDSKTALSIGPSIRASSDTVHRWQIRDAQASLLIGDCLLLHGEQEFRAAKILIVSDGPHGHIRNRIVFEGRQTPSGIEQTPRSAIWMTEDEPKIQTPQFRLEPRERPFLLEFLPSDSIQSVTNPTPRLSAPELLQAQYTEPTQSTPPATFTKPAQFTATPSPATPSPATPSTEPRPAGVSQPPTPALELMTPEGLPPAPLPPTTGLPLSRESTPPIITEDGATTGGFQFFFGGGSKNVTFERRDASVPPLVNITTRGETNESIVTARGGVTVIVRDVGAQLSDGQTIQFGTVTLSADRVVLWTPPLSGLFSGSTDISTAEGEIYLEGDVVFRQGDNLIYADSMYYNVTRETGMVLDAEAITSIPEYQGVVRLKAEVLQAVARGRYRAFDAAVTSSRMGVPRFWLQSEQIEFTEQNRNVIDARTQQLVPKRDYRVRSDNNFVFLGGVPVLYWPRFSTSLSRPVFYLTDAQVKNDSNFGTQVLLEWDVFQLFGVENVPDGVDWELSTDYLSDRGPALGTTLNYDLPAFFGFLGPTNGSLDIWGIDDRGLDRLGRDRLALPPEEDFRGRALWRHRQQLSGGSEFIAELGLISDRNFLEQYLENEWDQSPDHRTGLRLRRSYFNQLFDLGINVQLNDFFQETERLPEFNHYLIGASILRDRLTWSAHNHVSYSRLNVADTPVNAAEAAETSALPGEVAADGLIASTRQELALNLEAGPFDIRPSASIDVAHYGEAADGDSLTRVLGQTGIRLNLPMVRVDPTVQSSLFNIQGLAHKLNWTAEYWYADSDTNADELPFYDPLDDDAQEQFRRRFIGDLFGGTLPERFDPRNYAFRQGIQRNVTSPSDVIADDLQQFRLGLNQRFQTKRGLPGRERIVDIVQMDVGTILFPKADRDNFGETVGPTTYDFRYHIGDRFSIVSDGYIDWFSDGLRSVSAGVRSSRPGVGDY